MGLINSPNIVTSGLVAGYDAASLRSFRGTPATNLLTGVSYTRSNNSSTLFTVSNNTVTMYVPEMGTRTVYTTYMYNDYNGGSSECCPNYFSYGTSISVSGSTLYTYSIVYKTASGYTHPNFMYRYEYNSGGSYLTEGGVFNDSNRRYLGEGWYHAWGQFTTQATTATLHTYLFYYRYALNDVIYIAGASLTQGSEIPQPQHFLNYSTTRGTTNATGGGWVDLSGNGRHGELVNGPTYSNSNLGSLVLDGTNDYVETTTSDGFGLGGTGTGTMMFWVYATRKSGGGAQYQYIAGFRDDSDFDFFFLLLDNSGSSVLTEARLRTASGIYDINIEYVSYFSTWTHVTFVCNTNKTELYLNGVLAGQNTNKTGNFGANTSNFRIGANGNSLAYYAKANVASLQMYSGALSATQIIQNFNATRGRFGV
jgi:hypothetical protein